VIQGERVEGLLQVKECPHGRGVFALRDFRPGETIRVMGHMTLTTTPRSPPWKRWAIIIGRTSDGKQLFWDEEEESSEDYWSNFLDHRKLANVRFSIDLPKGMATLAAIRTIKSGDELFLNYKEYGPSNWTPD
jgi:hypothetical protein